MNAMYKVSSKKLWFTPMLGDGYPVKGVSLLPRPLTLQSLGAVLPSMEDNGKRTQKESKVLKNQPSGIEPGASRIGTSPHWAIPYLKVG
jgi:hypothetical protein